MTKDDKDNLETFTSDKIFKRRAIVRAFYDKFKEKLIELTAKDTAFTDMHSDIDSRGIYLY